MIFMKTIVIVISLILIVIVFGFVTINLLDTQSEKLYGDLITLQSSIESENWPEALSAYSILNKNWGKTRKTWTILIDHFEIDNINLSMAELEAFIKTEDKKEASAKLSALKILVKHIPEKEKVNMNNIF